MANNFKFLVIDDPSPYKDQIFKMWDDYLPGTPHERLMWLSQGNPAGAAKWVLAINESINEVVGTLSCLPKDIHVENRILKLGILGDFMVRSNYRTFGPALQLQRFISEHYSDLGFDFLCTIPNKESVKIIERVGFRPSRSLCCYSKPLAIKPYLHRYMPSPMAAMVAPIVNIGAIIVSWGIYAVSHGVLEECRFFDQSFDVFFDTLNSRATVPLSQRSSDYLNWRYTFSPLSGMRYITFRRSKDAKLSGYMIFRVYENRLEILDGAGLTSTIRRSLLKEVINIANREGRESVQFSVAHGGDWARQLRACGFFNNGDCIQVYCLGPYAEVIESLDLVSGDRNI